MSNFKSGTPSPLVRQLGKQRSYTIQLRGYPTQLDTYPTPKAQIVKERRSRLALEPEDDS